MPGLIFRTVSSRPCGPTIPRENGSVVRYSGWSRAGGQGRAHKEVRTCSATSAGLQELADWLADGGCTHVAMESTGVYWKPVYNLLDGRFTVIVANAAAIKRMPGRKTDVADSEWIA